MTTLADINQTLTVQNEMQEKTTKAVDSLTKRFASFLRITKGEKLEDLESRREARRQNRAMGFARVAGNVAESVKNQVPLLSKILAGGALSAAILMNPELRKAIGDLLSSAWQTLDEQVFQNPEFKKGFEEVGIAFANAAFAILEPLGSVIGTAINAALNPFAKQLRSDIRMAMNPATDSETQAITQFFTEGPVNQKRAAQLVLGTGEFQGLIDPLGENATPQQLEERKQRIRDVIMTLPGGEKSLSGGGAAAGFAPITSPEEQAMRLLKGRSELTGVEKAIGISDLPFDLESLLRIQEQGGVRLIPGQEVVRGVTKAITGQDPSENLVLTNRGFVYATEEDVRSLPNTNQPTTTTVATNPQPNFYLDRVIRMGAADGRHYIPPSESSMEYAELMRQHLMFQEARSMGMAASVQSKVPAIQQGMAGAGTGAPIVVPVTVPSSSGGASAGGPSAFVPNVANSGESYHKNFGLTGENVVFGLSRVLPLN
jgi:hypothetical protein